MRKTSRSVMFLRLWAAKPPIWIQVSQQKWNDQSAHSVCSGKSKYGQYHSKHGTESHILIWNWYSWLLKSLKTPLRCQKKKTTEKTCIQLIIKHWDLSTKMNNFYKIKQQRINPGE